MVKKKRRKKRKLSVGMGWNWKIMREGWKMKNPLPLVYVHGDQ
jgi:hypothetical protein